jgi:integrase
MKGFINKVGNSWGFTVTLGTDQNGKRMQKRFGKFKTKKEAEKACNDMIYQIDHGTFVNPQEITLGNYLQDWLKTYCEPNLTPCTYDGYRNNIEKHIIPALGKIPLQKLQPAQVQKLYNQKAESGRLHGEGGLSAASIRYIHAILRKSLNHAVKMQYISRNVCELVDVPKIKHSEANFLNKKQVADMLNAFKGTDIYVPTFLAVGLGLRRGEVLGLQWHDIDYDKKLITIQRTLLPLHKGNELFSECKTEKSHRVMAVPDNILICLKQAWRNQLENKLFFGQDYVDYDLVYSNPNGAPVSPHAYDHRFSKALKDHGFEHIRIHDLRHTNASLMLSQGVPMKVASERLGHTTIAITMDLYSHVDDALQQDAAIKLNNALCF